MNVPPTLPDNSDYRDQENKNPNIIDIKQDKKDFLNAVFPYSYTFQGFEIRRKNVNKMNVQCVCKFSQRDNPCKASIKFSRDPKTGMVKKAAAAAQN